MLNYWHKYNQCHIVSQLCLNKKIYYLVWNVILCLEKVYVCLFVGYTCKNRLEGFFWWGILFHSLSTFLSYSSWSWFKTSTGLFYVRICEPTWAYLILEKKIVTTKVEFSFIFPISEKKVNVKTQRYHWVGQCTWIWRSHER